MPMVDLRPPNPSCCAGLLQLTLRGWRQDFPLHPSPLREMARQAGASPKELLRAAEQLRIAGRPQSIRPCWGDALPRHRLRLAYRGQHSRLPEALFALPSCSWVISCREARCDPDLPTLWAELEALDPKLLERQLAELPPALEQLWQQANAVLQTTDPDPELGAALEEGLPFGSRPYALLARRLARSERQLLADLRRWQRAGLLHSIGLMEAAPTSTYLSWLPPHPMAWPSPPSPSDERGFVPVPPPSAAPPTRSTELRLRCLRPRPAALLFGDLQSDG